MRVIIPPSSDPNASGMRSFDALMRTLRDMDTTAGMSTAVAPTLFITPDIRPTDVINRPVSRVLLDPAMASRRSPSKLATPVRNSPPLTIKMAHTVMTAGLLKPENASAGVIRPGQDQCQQHQQRHHVHPQAVDDEK